MKTIEMDGVKYALTPLDTLEESAMEASEIEFYETKTLETACETFKFVKIYAGDEETFATEIEYSKEDGKMETWDNDDFIYRLVDGDQRGFREATMGMNLEEEELLKVFIEKVSELSWLKD